MMAGVRGPGDGFMCHPPKATILVADGSATTRALMAKQLGKEGYRILLAANGQEAVDLLKQEGCDLVLMAIHMSGVDGFSASRQIKAWGEHRGRMIPVVFLTSTSNDQVLARCLEQGGDDVIKKSSNPTMLMARVRACLQRSEEVNRLAQDRREVEEVILGMGEDPRGDFGGVRMLMKPLERTGGDLVLSARRPDGVQHLMLGDFTGHGLAAAVCGPPTSETFYRLTLRDHPLREILLELNRDLVRLMPVGRYLNAVFLELDRVGGVFSLWNAAMPQAWRVRSGRITDGFSSRLLPLGIREDWQCGSGECQSWAEGDALYLCSDGIEESRSASGDLFGEERLQVFLEDASARGADPADLLPVLEAFRAGAPPADDLTLVAVR